jgi:hypothetical protein
MPIYSPLEVLATNHPVAGIGVVAGFTSYELKFKSPIEKTSLQMKLQGGLFISLAAQLF